MGANPLHNRQFVKVMFDPADRRTYTYHCDEPEALRAGDKVIVDTPRGGSQVVEVVEAECAIPKFATKPCRRAPPPKAEPDAGSEDASA